MSHLSWRAVGAILTLLLGLALVVGLSSCAPAPAETSPTVGRLYQYVRSNRDGSLPEAISVYRLSDTQVEVQKVVSRCARSAYVTAELDLERNQPRALVGGQVATNGTQNPFAWLDYDPATRELHARIPGAEIDQRVAVAAEPWIIYDFDLSELTTLRAGRAPEHAAFSFFTMVVWPTEGSPDLFRTLGPTQAHFAGEETRLDRPALKYEVTGGLNGTLWLDAREGHVLEAEFAEPNHQEYADFRLVLQGVSDDAEAAWREQLRGQWANCPEEAE